jgi:phage tail sheath gpL-like
MGVPSNIIVPFVGIEFDPSRAQQGLAIMPFNVLLVGQSLTGASVPVETLIQVFSADEVANLCGTGSMLHIMAIAYFKNNQTINCYIIALADGGTATDATRTVTFTGTATAPGEAAIYVNSTRIAVPVSTGDEATDVGDALVSRYADYPYLPFDVANAAGVVTFTAKNGGLAAGDNDIRKNDEPTDQEPAGITIAIGTTTPGTIDPDIQDALDAIGDFWPTIIVNPYDDTTNLSALEDHLETQFGPMYQKDSVAYQAKRDTLANLVSFSTAAGRNCPSTVLIDAENVKVPTWQFAASIAGAIAQSASEDPAVPLQRLSIKGIRPNSPSDRRMLTERNNLAVNGIMTMDYEIGVQTDACVTMYLKNSAAAVDTAYRWQNTMYNLQYQRWSFRNYILSRYARAKLMDNAEFVKPGQQIITPSIGKLEAINWARELEGKGILENIDVFKKEIICRRSESNKTRLEWILPSDLVDQFVVGSGEIQFQ